MRKVLAVLLLLGGTFAGVAAGAADHPDSLRQPLLDGCNRSNLGLLAEATADVVAFTPAEVFPSWVYVDGSRTQQTVEGKVVASHTAGEDLHGVHETYDANIDVEVDPQFGHILSSRTVQENDSLHTEWETGKVPTWSWPSAGDHVRLTGSWIWDCGHWQVGTRQLPNDDNVPGDPLGGAGIEKIRGEKTELHPLSELATWRRAGGFLPTNTKRPVVASQLDVFISNQGGRAKAVEECALLTPSQPGTGALRLATNSCSELSEVGGRDYTYVLPAPGPRPSERSKLLAETQVHTTHNAPAGPRTRVVGDRIEVTVPFSRHGSVAALQDFGATVHAWWSDGPHPHRYRLYLHKLTINDNLDGDIGEPAANPTVDAPGEWNVYVDVGGKWINLHDPIPGHEDLVPGLGAVGKGPATFDLTYVDPVELYLTDGELFRLYVDARECDLPGYIDCPADELDFAEKPGRGEVVLPASQLHGATVVTLHPIVCATDVGCPEENSKPSQCPKGCWELEFAMDDLDVFSRPPLALVGDGTAKGTLVQSRRASSLSWWRDPIGRPAPDQDEEREQIARAIEAVRGTR